MNSMVHWQRHSCAAVHIGVDKAGMVYRVSVLPVDSNFIRRTDVMPFEIFINDGAKPRGEYEQDCIETGVTYATALHLFDMWFQKCELGVSKYERPCLFIPMFESVAQMEAAKKFWSHGIYDEFFTKLPRITELAIAYRNDNQGLKGYDIAYGKNTTSQCASKTGVKWEKDCKGLIRAQTLALTYRSLSMLT